ncbi:MAG TPA: long-chain fatty acid--CoA ligase [Proteobacteria bacterium]|nr:long-chain fatty acid--CoA ligase [Pseudomonadota bacterium]
MGILKRCPYPESTLMGKFLNQVAKYRDKTFIIAKFKDGRIGGDYRHISWLEVFNDSAGCARFLLKQGVEKGDRVALFADNSPWWIATMQGILSAGCVVVPIYPTLVEDEVAFILEDSGAKGMFVGSAGQYRVAKSVLGDVPGVGWAVVFDPDVDLRDPNWWRFGEVVKTGDEGLDGEIASRIEATKDGDIATILYTSGTTGRPKGVPLTHANFLYQQVLMDEYDADESDVWLNHLPLCHSYGLVADLFAAVDRGGILGMCPTIGTKDVREALATIRPTVLVTVPRLFEKMYHQITSALESQPERRRRLFYKAVSVSKEYHERRRAGEGIPLGLKLKWMFYEWLVFRRVRERIGLERIKFAASGGGPISKDLVLFFEALGIPVYQGYGLTETSPIINANTPKHNKPGSVGRPLPGTEERIADDGEILVRGPGVFGGYWNNPEATREVFTDDGFFMTGDIGHFDEDGYLYITDRKKEIIVTAGGKNIAPTPIETRLMTDPFIEQACVVGEGRKFIAALIVPAFETLREWAKSKGLDYGDDAELVKLPEVLELYQQRIDEFNKTVARFEQVKKFALLSKPFSIEGGELTPTQKFKRRVIDVKYRDIIESFYGEGE